MQKTRTPERGAGGQSSALLPLSVHGVLPKADAAFPDPGWERPETYVALDRLERDIANAAVSKSACIGCLYTSNKGWGNLLDGRPAQWAESGVESSDPLRIDAGNHGQDPDARPGLPAPLPHDPTAAPRRRHPRLIEAGPAGAGTETWEGDPDGCSPWSCRSRHSVDVSAATYLKVTA